MKTEMLKKFKDMFEDEKNRLVYSQSVVNEDFEIAKDDYLDESDLSSAELETSMRMRLRNREALFIKKIDEALMRIEDGSFGDCESCGDGIDLKRLEARPTATQCISCKEESERRETLHIDGLRSKSLGARIRFA